jgi:acyl-CoA synthetase (AMP-forming)/AMP-acid ligase II
MKSHWASLKPSAANFSALSPVTFLPRAAEIFPERIAVIHGERRFTYAELHDRARRLASALAKSGVERGDVVAAMLPNIPAMLEAHYGVPMLGAVLNTINTRLDADTVAYILEHGEAKVFVTDRMFSGVTAPALKTLKRKILVVDVDDPLYTGAGERVGSIEYEAFLERGSPDHPWSLPPSESDPIALNYTSGTTGRPKGVVYHHRGTFLEACGNIMAWAMPASPVYLWTLPMFHCNGWCFPWSVTAMAGTHVCLRAVEPKRIFELIVGHGVTHMCGAPTVLTMLITAPESERRRFPHTVHIQTGGSPPPAKVIKAMEELGFKVLHIYGMTVIMNAGLRSGATIVMSAGLSAYMGARPSPEAVEVMQKMGVDLSQHESQLKWMKDHDGIDFGNQAGDVCPGRRSQQRDPPLRHRFLQRAERRRSHQDIAQVVQPDAKQVAYRPPALLVRLSERPGHLVLLDRTIHEEARS